jgi:hypothetical protein
LPAKPATTTRKERFLEAPGTLWVPSKPPAWRATA